VNGFVIRGWLSIVQRLQSKNWNRGRRVRDHMVVGITTNCATVPITAKVVSSNPVHGKVY